MNRFKSVHVLSGSLALVVALAATGGSASTEVLSPSLEPSQTRVLRGTQDMPSGAIEQVESVFPVSMSVCPRMAKLNRPETDENLVVIGYEPLVSVEGKVTLAAAPVAAACISSGFGPRARGNHKGIDYFNHEAVDIFAAGAGVVKEKTYRNDFGNMLVIDHGNGVFTRYAHLQKFSPGLEEGAEVEAGEVIGVMGNTASYRIARHLHYEVLTGEWGEQAGSFALTPINVFSLPAARSEAKS